MRERTISIAALTILSAMVGIYSFTAGVALLFGGAIGAYAGSGIGNLVFALGGIFLGISLAAYVMSIGLWFRKSWSWAGAMVVFAALVVANFLLAFIATNFVSLLLPVAGAAVAVALLTRPATKFALLGLQPEVVQKSSGPAGAEVAKSAV